MLTQGKNGLLKYIEKVRYLSENYFDCPIKLNLYLNSFHVYNIFS